MSVPLNVNGRDASLAIDPSTPLLWALREDLGLTGTKFGCGAALCGACTVHVDGQAVRSCVTPVSAVAGSARVATIESMRDDRVGRAVVEAWVRNDVAQCGYCQSGQVMAAVALLKANRRPTDAQIDEALAGHLCRCGAYLRIRAAVRDAAVRLQAA